MALYGLPASLSRPTTEVWLNVGITPLVLQVWSIPAVYIAIGLPCAGYSRRGRISTIFGYDLRHMTSL